MVIAGPSLCHGAVRPGHPGPLHRHPGSLSNAPEINIVSTSTRTWNKAERAPHLPGDLGRDG
jgi:hypothetical protein